MTFHRFLYSLRFQNTFSSKTHPNCNASADRTCSGRRMVRSTSPVQHTFSIPFANGMASFAFMTMFFETSCTVGVLKHRIGFFDEENTPKLELNDRLCQLQLTDIGWPKDGEVNQSGVSYILNFICEQLLSRSL